MLSVMCVLTKQLLQRSFFIRTCSKQIVQNCSEFTVTFNVWCLALVLLHRTEMCDDLIRNSY